MKSGATFLIGIASDIDDIEKVDSVIFTIRGKEELQKNYPEDVAFDENHNFLIPLTQEETTLLAGQYGHKVLVEGQVNFVDKSVNKTETVDFFISGTLATEIIDGNTPSAYPITEVSLRFMDGIVIADLNPDAFDEKITEKVAELTADMQTEIDNKVDKVDGKGLSTEDFTTEEKTKLESVESGAQKNKVNSVNSKTGDVVLTALNIGALPDTTTHLSGDIPVTQKGAAFGVAELDENGKVISSQLPSYVDDVLEFPNVSDFPTKGESGKIYIATSTNLSYRWTGSDYTVISPSIALGETSSTAYRGDRGKTAYDHSQTIGNPHQTTKAEVGLGNVDNTSDANKPVSTATQAALNSKVDKVSGKSLIDDSEIERLASVHNYDDTEIKEEIENKADKSDVDLVGVSSGNIDDSADGHIRSLHLIANTTQGENPSQTNPQEIHYFDGEIVTSNGDSSTHCKTYPLYSIGDVKDELIVYADGHGEFIKRIDRMIIDGNTMEFARGNSTLNDLYVLGAAYTPSNTIKTGDNTKLARCMTTYNSATELSYDYVYKHAQTNAMANLNGSGRISLFFQKGVFPAISDFNAWKIGKEIECLYECTPQIVQLTSEEVSEILSLRTFSTETNVEIQNATHDIGYWKSNQNGQTVADVDSKIPFRFGITEDGQYGYYKVGADSVTPFSSGGSSKPTYLITNSGSGLFVTDLSTFEETKLTASEINTYHVSDAFKLDWNVYHRNCYTVVATGNVTVYWRRTGQYTYQSVDLTDGGEQFIFAASEYGYAIVVCN